MPVARRNLNGVYQTGELLRTFEVELYKFLETRHPGVLGGIKEKKQLDDQLKGALDGAIREFSGEFAARRASAA